VARGSGCVGCLGVGSFGEEGGAIVVTNGHRCCMRLHASTSASITDEKSRSSSSELHRGSVGIRDCWVGIVAVGGVVGVAVSVAVDRRCMCSHASAILSSSDE